MFLVLIGEIVAIHVLDWRPTYEDEDCIKSLCKSERAWPSIHHPS
jgi:hypothetical protein